LPSSLVFELKVIIQGFKFKGNFLTRIALALLLTLAKVLKKLCLEGVAKRPAQS
jgi:hypothetical protein